MILSKDATTKNYPFATRHEVGTLQPHELSDFDTKGVAGSRQASVDESDTAYSHLFRLDPPHRAGDTIMARATKQHMTARIDMTARAAVSLTLIFIIPPL